ncbi:TetR family transcriptional regulator [Curtobacterium flaccumfaciens]|nr:TetR family transcriptional regulator [Curtobacterium flaccumfaciens]
MPRDGTVARERLQRAALELMGLHGFDGVTAQQIAEHAHVTERTFFRHFADKREALFASEDELRTELRRSLRAAPGDLPPLAVLRHAAHGVVPLLERNRPLSVPRAKIITGSAALMERERTKAAALVDLVEDELSSRGVDRIDALLCARVGMDVFATAIRSWMQAGSTDLDETIDETFHRLHQHMTAALGPQEQLASPKARHEALLSTACLVSELSHGI